jgi:hypothetical protein
MSDYTWGDIRRMESDSYWGIPRPRWTRGAQKLIDALVARATTRHQLNLVLSSFQDRAVAIAQATDDGTVVTLAMARRAAVDTNVERRMAEEG